MTGAAAGREPSTRTRTRLSGRYQRTTGGSRSLERGLDLLRAFRLGTGVLTNAELAARTGLPRPTVSRLTRSLVEGGFLAYDHGEGGYRLGAVHLSLALSFRTAQVALDMALPLMRELAQGCHVNVGLAVLDRTEMVYLDSVRPEQPGIARRAAPGTRTPVARTALDMAYLSSLPPVERRALLKRLAHEHPTDWPAVQEGIEASLRNVRRVGYCWAQWQPRIFSVATPMMRATGEHYALNISLAMDDHPAEDLIEPHGASLLALKRRIVERWESNTA